MSIDTTAPFVSFASAAVRDATLTNPRIGQACVLIDSGSLLVYYGGVLGWRAPWNLPWGVVACSELATTPGQFPTFPNIGVSGLDVAFTPVAGRKYAVKADFWLVGNSPSTQVAIKLYTSAAAPPVRADGTVFTDATELGEKLFYTPNAGIGDDSYAFEVPYVPADATPAHVFLVGSIFSGVSASLVIGEGTACSLKVTDAGPNANPTYPSP